MAGNVIERLIIEIGGDARKFKQELKSLQKANKDGEKSFQKLALVGKAGFLAVAAAAAAVTVASTKAFVAFEKGATNVAKTTNLAGQELEDFKKEIMDLSEEIPVTTDKLLEIATAAGQLGIKGADNLTIFTETIAKLGATTDLEGENAAISIARILNLTNESITSVDKFGSTIVDLGNNFATSESQILEVATEVAKATVNFKLGSPEILAMSTAMSALGIQAEAGSTVVGKAFMKIDEVVRQQGGPAFEKLIELTGMSGDELTKTFQTDATKVFQSFVEGLGEAGQSGKSMAEELNALGLSGIRVEKILPTLAERSDILASSLNRAGKAAKENSALNEEAARAFETSASKLQIAQNKINNTLIDLGANIAPVVVEAIEDISNTIRENKGAVELLGTALSMTIKAIIFVVKTLADSVNSFVADIKRAKQNILDIVYFWIGAFINISKVANIVFDFVSGKIRDFVGYLGTVLAPIQTYIQEKIINVFNLLKEISTQIFDNISKSAGEFTDLFRSKTKPIQNIISNIIGVFLSLSAATTQIFDSIGNKISEFVDYFKSKISEIQGFVSSITPDFLKFGDVAGEGIKKADDATKESSKSIIETISDLIKKYRDAGKEWVLSDAEVTNKVEENKNKRVKSQKDETEEVKKESQTRSDAVIAIAEEQRKKQEEIDAERLRRQKELNNAELELLSAQLSNKSKTEIEALQSRFNQIKEANDINNEILKLQEKDSLTAIEQQQLEHLTVLLSLKRSAHEEEKQSLEDLLKEVRKGEKTRTQIIEDGIVEREKDRVKEHNQRIKDEIEFGETMAAIKAVQRTAEYQGTKNAAGELAVLINSENDNLKAIGKAATMVQIGISTAESAMKAYAGLAWIPVVGFGLGVLAAAAVTAYGAEQISNVQKMKEGGIVPGSGRGDKIPALLEPGELVVPRDITMELMDRLGARKMAEGGRATGAKENENLYQTFADMFNPATFIRSLVYEYIGWGDDAGAGANEPAGFGAELLGGMIGGMIKKAEGGVEDLADMVLNNFPGGEAFKEFMKWSKMTKEQINDIMKDIIGEGPLYDFLNSIDSELSNMLFSGAMDLTSGAWGAATGLADALGDALGGLGGHFGLRNGGIVPGSGSGDIVPAFLEPGELVVPKDLTSSLLSISPSYSNIKMPSINGSLNQQSQNNEQKIFLEVNLKDELVNFITIKQRERGYLGI